MNEQPPPRMNVYGITMVRDEADIIAANIRYHLALGVDHITVLDNGSTDGTDSIVEQLAREDDRVRWLRNDGPFQQGELITQLAREATDAGADWIVPFDADEFWYAPWADFRAVLANSEAGALRCQVLHYVQRREQIEATSEGLLTMTRRGYRMMGPPDQCCALVEGQRIAHVEIMYDPKWISRASHGLTIEMGNHSAANLSGKAETTADLVCLHAPLRARNVLEGKATDSARIRDAGTPDILNWHIHRLARVLREGKLEAEWAANSYLDDALDVYGTARPLIFDPTLRDAVLPFISNGSSPLNSGQRSSCDKDETWARSAAKVFLTSLHEDAAFHKERGYELNRELDRARKVIEKIHKEVAEKNAWALAADQEAERARAARAQMEAELNHRTAWARTADEEAQRARAALQKLQQEFEERSAWALALNQEVAELRKMLEAPELIPAAPAARG